MTELDLDRAILEDRHTPLPGQPDINTTLAAVRPRVSVEKKPAVSPRLCDCSPQERGILGVSGIATALGVAWIVSSSSSLYLLLVIPSIELVALKTLVKEGSRS